MLKDITFGQYYDAKSPVHKCDPRVKIVLMFAFIVLIFVAQNGFALLFSAVSVLFVLLISKVPMKLFFKNLKSIWFILVFTAVINLFYSSSGEVLVGFWKIESLLSPLKYIGLKNGVHTFAMMMTIALRFIPTLIEEAEKIMNAQKARGADLENGKLVERIKALIPILIPLLISSVRRAYELAEAMECRCYNGGEGKTRMKQLHMGITDIFAFFFITVYIAGVILLNIFL